MGITDIQEAILVLTDVEYAELRDWFGERDWERWDEQIEADSDAGRLDPLIAEAHESRTLGRLDVL